MVQYNVELARARFDGLLSFLQLRIRVVGSFMEADDAGDDDGRATQVGDTACDKGEAHADALWRKEMLA